MKKPAAPVKTEKHAKRTPEEKSARKSTKNAGRATAELNDDRDTKKASQKKSLKSAAKQLQKELNKRMNEVVTRIRKETKAKLKEVVKEATRRLDGDTERMFEQALHTIVRHYDSVSGLPAASNGSETSTAAAPGKATKGRKKSQTLNKDGSVRKARTARATDGAAEPAAGTSALKTKSRKTGTAAAKAKPAASGARRGPKPRVAALPADDGDDTSIVDGRRGPKPKPNPEPSSARRAPKPRAQAAPEPEATDVLNSADSPSTGEVSA